MQKDIIFAVVVFMLILYIIYEKGIFGNCDSTNIFRKMIQRKHIDPLEQEIYLLAEEINSGNVE